MARSNRLSKSILFMLVALSFCLVVMALIIPSTPLQAASPTLISADRPTMAFSSETGRGASFGIDSDTSNTSYWASDLGPNKTTWWQIDLQNSYFLSQIKIRNWVGGERYYHYYIRGSMDGVNWTPIAVKSNNSIAKNVGDQYNVAVTARYIRVNVTYNSANHSAHISDFKVFGTPMEMPSKSMVQVSSVETDKGAYSIGNSINLSYDLKNTSASTTVKINSIKAKLHGLTNPFFLRESILATSITLTPGQIRRMSGASIWSIPSGTPTGAYAVYLQYTLSDGTIWETYESFFRITNSSQLTSYKISSETYKGLDIFTLKGGLSAEYAVVKSGEALAAGISNSWDIPGASRGPNPIYSTPDFLDKSVETTVEYYNNNFGMSTKFDTVIISTGVSSVPYLARAMKAPVLPLQFLVTVDTIKELQTILKEANSTGFSAYSTIGYDGSLPAGVAWIKLLDLPQAYKDFLNQHQVKNIVIMGSNGTTGGETTSKKIMNTGISAKGENPGDVFVIYTRDGTSYDVKQLTRKIKDYTEAPLESNYRQISDWESGVIQSQISQFSRSIKNGTAVKAIDYVTGLTYIHLYDFATYASLEFLKKNETYLAKDGAPVRGVVLNPYLVSHPFYESKIHYIPLLFWQYDSATKTINTRLHQTVRKAVSLYFPQLNFNDLQMWIRTSNNFPASTITTMKNQMMANGITNIHSPDYSNDEVWDPIDGMTAPNEVIATNLLTYSTAEKLKAWDTNLLPLSMSDLESIPAKYSGISVTRQ